LYNKVITGKSWRKMSEMSEVNHSRPSLNGMGAIGAQESEGGQQSSTLLNSTIPMQEVSAVREEHVPAAAHYLPSDDRSTAAAASAAIQKDEGMTTAIPTPSSETKASNEGPGHESDVREMNGTGLASVLGQSKEESVAQRELVEVPTSAGE
jgi:hypothetical protein